MILLARIQEEVEIILFKNINVVLLKQKYTDLSEN